MENREIEPEFEEVTADIGLELLEDKVREYKEAMEADDIEWMESVLNSSCLSCARIVPE